jgi:cytochrome c-type biogenesis protein
VLPLIPIYLSLISGVSLDQLQSKDRGKRLLLKTISTSLVFILGFSTVFFLLGATATALGSAMDSAKDIIAKVLAVFIFIFGLHFIGVYRFKFLAFEKKIEARAKPMNYTVSTMAWTSGTVSKGVVYLLAYSLGIAIPFLLTAIAFNYLLGVFSWIKRHFRIIEIISGSLLVIVAILIFMGWMNKISTLLVPQEDTEMSTGFESMGQMDYDMPADYQMDTDSSYELEMSEDSNLADTLK